MRVRGHERRAAAPNSWIRGCIAVAITATGAAGCEPLPAMDAPKDPAMEAARGAEAKKQKSRFIADDVVEGTGPAAQMGDTVLVHYTGTLTDGAKFDSSLDRGEPFEVTIGKSSVIQGWHRGLVGMKVGGKRKLTIPPELGYGARGMPPTIPPDATLLFEIQLLALNGQGTSPTGEPTASDDVVTETIGDIPDAIAAAITATDRSEEDRALDAGRHPAETLTFFGIAPGQRVAEVASGRGYTAELLARVVGKSGKVYGHNAPFLLKRFAEKPWTERLKKAVMTPVVRVDREFDAPIPPDVTGLDAVLVVLFYHDTVWLDADRDKMNRAAFAALKPGGVYGIVDHSAKAGRGTADAKKLHRIEEVSVIEEVTRAGFVLDARATFLANPADPRDWNASPTRAGVRRGTSDRFVLRFRKPKSQRPMHVS